MRSHDIAQLVFILVFIFCLWFFGYWIDRRNPPWRGW